MIAGPLHDGHRARRADAAATLVLTTDAPNGSRATIRGFGWCAEDGQISSRDLAEQRPTALAAKQAFEAAGVSDPVAELARVETYNAYAIDEVLAAEALGLAAPGKGSTPSLTVPRSTRPVASRPAAGPAAPPALCRRCGRWRRCQLEPGALLASQGWCGCGASSSAVAVFEIDG